MTATLPESGTRAGTGVRTARSAKQQRGTRRYPGAAAVRVARDWLDRPMTSLHLVFGVFLLLLGFGLLMVLSSSAAIAYAQSKSSFAVFTNQALFAVIGLVAFFFTMRMPLRVIRSLSTTAVMVALVLLVAVLVPGIGRTYNGARSWIGVGDQLQFQPSEIAKLALLLWAAHVLAARRSMLRSWRALLVPVLPVFLLMVGLVMLQPDLGTTITLSVVFVAVMWAAGAPMWLFGVMLSFIVAGGVYLATSAGYRAARITAFLHPDTADPKLTYQLFQGLYGMGSGGIFGVGLGNSKMKWSWLPNADSDFIFAVIGEELGLLGTLTVIVLFATLAYTGIRIARRNVDPFVKVVASAGTIWLVGQAIINIGYVVGLLPVTGIPLPMISSGGTSLVTTMVVFGLLANFARREPQAAAALRSGGPRGMASFLGVGTPVARTPKRVTRHRARREAKRAALAVARLDELTAISDEPRTSPAAEPRGGVSDPYSRRSPAGLRQAPEPGPRRAVSTPVSRPARTAKPARAKKYRLRRTFGFAVPGAGSSVGRVGGRGFDTRPARPGSTGTAEGRGSTVRADGRGSTGGSAAQPRPGRTVRP